jgi:hypothetical protein
VQDGLSSVRISFSLSGISSMTDRNAAGHEVLSVLADGEWHRLAEIAVPLAALANPELSAAIALGSIARFRDEGYEIEKDTDSYRLLSVPDRRTFRD